MYATHQPKIAEFVQSPVQLRQVCEFVLATIRVPFPRAIEAYKAKQRSGHLDSAVYFSAKLEGLRWLEANQQSLYNVWARAITADQLIAAFVCIPGIGLAKAGFLAQLTKGVSACMDTHNLARYGLKEDAFRFRKEAKYETKMRHIIEYNHFVRDLGGTEKLWDDWCAYVSEQQGYGSPEQVSAMHLEVIV